MKNKNKIDGIFSEGLANHSETPPAYVWDAISDGMHGTKQNKKALILWRSLAAAAVIGLIFLGGIYWNNLNQNMTIADTNLSQPNSTEQGNKINTLPLDSNKETSTINDSSSPVEKPQNISTKETAVPNKSPGSLAVQNNINSQTNSANTVSKTSSNKEINAATQKVNNNQSTPNYKAIDNESLVGSLNKVNNQTDIQLTNYAWVDATQLFNYKNNTTLKAITTPKWLEVYNTATPKLEKAKRGLEFALGGQFSPSYSYHETSATNSAKGAASREDGIMSYTGGVHLNIKTKKRWEIETGIYYSQVGQKFSNSLIGNSDKTFYNTTPNAGIQSKKPNLQNSLGNIQLNASAEEKLIQEVAIFNASIRINSENASFIQNEMQNITVQQELNYIEIPFLVRYNIMDKSVGLSVSGGVSSNFLIGNNAYKIEDNTKSRIGETQNINDVGYSAIFGLGLRTPILKALDFNFEPRVKYFMNSITHGTESNYKPYSIGIYTGVSYRF